MNELESQLSKVLEKAIAIAEQTGEFVIDQAPMLLQEFYLWHTIKATVAIIISISLFFILRKIHHFWSYKSIPEGAKQKRYVLKSGRYYFTSWSDGSSESFNAAIIMRVASHFILIWTIIELYKLLYILIAPKLYLIDYFIH